MSIEAYYQSKIMACFLLIIFSVSFIGVNHYIETNKILSNLLYSQGGEVYYKNLENIIENKTNQQRKEMIKEEKAVINKFKGEKLAEDELTKELEKLGLSNLQIKRITSKIEVLNGMNVAYYKLILMVFFIGLIGYNYPHFSLEMDRYINKKAYVAEDISRLYSVAIILSKNKDMTVKKLLKWLESYSIAFKPYFKEINDVYHEQGTAILKKMYHEVPYDEMKLLFDNLISAESLPLEMAFKGIEHTLSAKIDDRQEEIAYGVNFQITLSESLAAGVVHLTLILYGGIPLMLSIYLMMEKMNASTTIF